MSKRDYEARIRELLEQCEIIKMPKEVTKEGRFYSHLEDFLYNQATIPEYQCRFKWEENSIAFWDNRACQHYATGDYWPAVRRVERVTVIGNKPV